MSVTHNHCPICYTENISELSPIESDEFGIQAWQHMKCDVCNITWNNIYILSSYELDDNCESPEELK
jgi:transposase-like protein